VTTLCNQTIERAAAFERVRPALAAAECAVLAPQRPRLVLGDIPPIAFDVARGLGVPGIAVGNFAWDWIYANLGSTRPETPEVVASIAASEARADLLLRLPLHAEMAAFPTVEDVPLIARIAARDREVVRRELGIPSGAIVALLSFGGFDLQRLDPAVFAHTPEITFLTTLPRRDGTPGNVVNCAAATRHYEELVAACDVAIIKPGWGTIADCVANRVPVVYTTRPGFPEEPALVAGLERLGPAAFISQEALFAGEVRPAIAQVLARRHDWQSVRLDGADVIARRVLDIAGVTARV
jgi:hypothetical protein